MRPRDSASLLDIAKATRLALEFIQGVSQAEFEVDRKTQSAVLHQAAIEPLLPNETNAEE